jgi:hypothetical protein
MIASRDAEFSDLSLACLSFGLARMSFRFVSSDLHLQIWLGPHVFAKPKSSRTSMVVSSEIDSVSTGGSSHRHKHAADQRPDM